MKFYFQFWTILCKIN